MLERGVGPLRGGEEGGRFLGQRGGIKLRLGKSGGRKGGERSPMGRSRIRMGRVFGSLGLLRGVRTKRWRGLGRGWW